MHTSDHRSPTRFRLAASLLMLGLFGSLAANASDGAQASAKETSCREETRRVTVWEQPGNPKNKQVARIENRLVTVCDGKVVSSKDERTASK